MKKYGRALFVALAMLVVASAATVFFEEDFRDGDKWKSRWIQSTAENEKFGEFSLSAGEFYANEVKDKGLMPVGNHRQFAIAAQFKPFTNQGKELVLQYTVKHQQKLDCGGSYVKLFPSTTDVSKLRKKTKFSLMFGPEVCGGQDQKINLIFNYKGKEAKWKKKLTFVNDEFTHVYSLRLLPDNTYIVNIDGENKEQGSLGEDFNFTIPLTIPDPNAKKPEDWDDRKYIPDPNDKKPKNWDSIPEKIPKPGASKPYTWDEDFHGEWKAPMVPNPKYKGEWKPAKLPNPNYSGSWERPRIPNPDHPDTAKDFYVLRDIGSLGIEVTQARAGSVFDNFLITDDWTHARRFIQWVFKPMKAKEEKMLESIQFTRAQRMRVEAYLNGEGDEDDFDDADYDDGFADTLEEVTDISDEEREFAENLARELLGSPNQGNHDEL